MTHGSLFSGIGGFDLAAGWAGWRNAFNCEIDPFCRTVLKYHFPDAEQFTDIRTADFSIYRGLIDVLSGGFPCQPFSTAGKRKGTEDDRYLWPAMLGVIRAVQPRWVVGENVYGIVSWSQGLVFDQVCADLEAEGYEVQPYVLPACGVDAPHLRYRTWFVARLMENPGSLGCCGQKFLRQQPGRTATVGTSAVGMSGEREAMERFVAHRPDPGVENVRRERENTILSAGVAADANGHRFRLRKGEQIAIGGRENPTHLSNGIPGWQDFPTQSPVCRGDDGLSGRLDFDAVFAGVPKPRRAKAYNRWRKEAVKAYGNAIVPQVAYQIFQTINEYENLNQWDK